jgi:hypothetical protein
VGLRRRNIDALKELNATEVGEVGAVYSTEKRSNCKSWENSLRLATYSSCLQTLTWVGIWAGNRRE